jgi:hypothetical protein
MTAKIQVRRDTTTNWNAPTPPTLDVGEIGLDTTLKQIKIGDGSSNWTALPWLGGTLPTFASPNANIDDASLRVPGVYRWAGIASITSGTVPAAPIDIKAADGGINMLVLAFGSVVLQHLWTDGDGSQPQKSLTRIFDTTYRAWTPQNIWGFSATEGVDVVAKSITLKDTGTGLTVDGNSTLTGNVTINGTTTLGNAATDVVTVQAGSVGAPIITTNGDSDTGIYFPAANTVSIATFATQALTVGPTQGVTLAGNLSVLGQLAAALHCGSQRLTNVGTATAATDAISNTEMSTMTHMGYQTSNAASGGTQGTITMTIGGIGTTSTTITPSAGNWCGLVANIQGSGAISAIGIKARNGSPLINNANPFTVTGPNAASGVLWFLIRVL